MPARTADTRRRLLLRARWELPTQGLRSMEPSPRTQARQRVQCRNRVRLPHTTPARPLRIPKPRRVRWLRRGRPQLRVKRRPLAKRQLRVLPRHPARHPRQDRARKGTRSKRRKPVPPSHQGPRAAAGLGASIGSGLNSGDLDLDAAIVWVSVFADTIGDVDTAALLQPESGGARSQTPANGANCST